MKLLPACEDDLAVLMTWFADAPGTRAWGGPHFRYPFTPATFREDTHFDTLRSLALRTGDGVLAGFGQSYAKRQRVHLARLAIAPDCRGRGLGGELVRDMLADGQRELGLQAASLFVRADNAPAIACYVREGFADAPWPDGDEILPGVRFMIREW